MGNIKKKFVNNLCIIFIAMYPLFVKADNPCAARAYPNQSVVCVCNNTYCDDVTRQPPEQGQFVTYVSSKAGLRFDKTVASLLPWSSQTCSDPEDEENDVSFTLELDPTKQYQTIEGFGAAVTDSAAINWKSLSKDLQNYLIESFFSSNGIEYNMLRVPIGGCDFSTHAYAYNEHPTNDRYLKNFSLTTEDTKFKIPMIKAAQKVATSPIDIIASTWSPPVWMKTSAGRTATNFTGRSDLKEQYYDTYALYHLKFAQAYAKRNITLWAITTTNEPTNGEVDETASITINQMGWTAHNLARWVVSNLGPTIRNSKFNDIKILLVDDQRSTLPYFFNKLINDDPRVLDWIDGVAVHNYADTFVPPTFLDDVTKADPSLIVLNTEASQGAEPKDPDVLLGSWERAKIYARDIIEDLNQNLVGWLEWNLCLNSIGGPSWTKNYVDAAVIVYPESGEFIKQPMYYAIGHFSKFLPRGSKRIAINVVQDRPRFIATIRSVAFLRPERDSIVVILYNDALFDEANTPVSVAIRFGDQQAIVDMDGSSIATVELPYQIQDCR